jgi:hypothetical protein
VSQQQKMKKTYFNSPILPLITFIAFAVSTFLLLYFQGHFFGNEARYAAGVLGVGAICLVAWLGLIVRVDRENGTINRYLFLFFAKTHALSDIVSLTDKVETDVYGKHPYTQVRFKNGDTWNITMFARKDVAEIKQML